MKYYKWLFMLLLPLFSCSGSSKKAASEEVEASFVEKKIRMVTMFGSTSYFIFKGEDMGYEYELCEKMADDLGLELEILTAKDEDEMINMLVGGEADLIAYKLGYTNERKEILSFTNVESVTSQVLVQRAGDSVKNVVDLIGKDVYVLKNTRYEHRLRNLNDELGGGINMLYVPDSSNTEDMIQLVSQGKVSYFVADEDVANVNKTYYSNIDCSLKISFPQRSAWAVSKLAPDLSDAINEWYKELGKTNFLAKTYRKYFDQNKYFETKGLSPVKKGNYISDFDAIFRRYAKNLDWDWRLLSAVAYCESQFDTLAVSWVGACGLMQLMPNTASMMGLEEEDIFQVEPNIAAGTKYISRLEAIFRQVENHDERIKFVLAAYNAGPGHVIDAINLAEKYGKNPDVWDDNVAVYIRLKSHEEYYTDPVCKYGYCRGTMTAQYVKDILERYEKYKTIIKE